MLMLSQPSIACKTEANSRRDGTQASSRLLARVCRSHTELRGRAVGSVDRSTRRKRQSARPGAMSQIKMCDACDECVTSGGTKCTRVASCISASSGHVPPGENHRPTCACSHLSAARRWATIVIHALHTCGGDTRKNYAKIVPDCSRLAGDLVPGRCPARGLYSRAAKPNVSSRLTRLSVRLSPSRPSRRVTLICYSRRPAAARHWPNSSSRPSHLSQSYRSQQRTTWSLALCTRALGRLPPMRRL